MTLGDIKQLSSKDVSKYYKHYEMVSGLHVSKTVVSGSISALCKVIDYVLPINDPDLICYLMIFWRIN